jgi:hypothetical protein
MPGERKSDAAPHQPPPQRRTSFGAVPGSRNRGFASVDPERQRQAPTDVARSAPGGTTPQQPMPQSAPAARAERRRPRGRDKGGSG